jgi:hypothetical protein
MPIFLHVQNFLQSVHDPSLDAIKQVIEQLVRFGLCNVCSSRLQAEDVISSVLELFQRDLFTLLSFGQFLFPLRGAFIAFLLEKRDFRLVPSQFSLICFGGLLCSVALLFLLLKFFLSVVQSLFHVFHHILQTLYLFA